MKPPENPLVATCLSFLKKCLTSSLDSVNIGLLVRTQKVAYLVQMGYNRVDYKSDDIRRIA